MLGAFVSIFVEEVTGSVKLSIAAVFESVVSGEPASGSSTVPRELDDSSIPELIVLDKWGASSGAVANEMLYGVLTAVLVESSD